MRTVRPATESDLDAIVAVFDRVVDERMWLGTEPGYDKEMYRDRWLGQIEGRIEGMLSVVEVDGTIAGSIGIYVHPEYGWMLGMFVDAPARGSGAGQAMLEAAIAWAKAKGVPALALLVFAHNERAIHLYKRNGFVREEYYDADVTRQGGEVWDTMLMVKRL